MVKYKLQNMWCDSFKKLISGLFFYYILSTLFNVPKMCIIPYVLQQGTTV